jgi:hypothetical protein
MARSFVAVLLPRTLCDAAAEIRFGARSNAGAFRAVGRAGELSPDGPIPRDLTNSAWSAYVVWSGRRRDSYRWKRCWAPCPHSEPGSSVLIWIDLIEGRNPRRPGATGRARLIDAGFGPPDKPWRSHLTLGRVERGVRVSRDWHLVAAAPQRGHRVDALALMQSELRPGGPRYTALETVHATP